MLLLIVRKVFRNRTTSILLPSVSALTIFQRESQRTIGAAIEEDECSPSYL